MNLLEFEDTFAIDVDWAIHHPELPHVLRMGTPEEGKPTMMCQIPEDIRLEVPGCVDGGLKLTATRIMD